MVCCCCVTLLLLPQIPASEAYEHSELILYKAMVLEEGGRLEDALHVLDSEKVCEKEEA